MLKLILERRPPSIAELAEMAGRKTSNVSCTLKTPECCGIVNLKTVANNSRAGGRAAIKPVVVADRFDFRFVL